MPETGDCLMSVGLPRSALCSRLRKPQHTNTRPHVRSAVGAGFQVCFTDGGDTVAPVSKSARPPMGAPLDEVNTEFMDVPF